MRSGLHYIAVNLLASSLFLVGVAMLYGVTGTLNMADMAAKLPHVPAADRGLLHAGAAILGVAFLIKAAIWPLNFWLVPAYAAASAPVAALFAHDDQGRHLRLLRLWTLLLLRRRRRLGAASAATRSSTAGSRRSPSARSACSASQQLGRLAGFSIIVSSGTLLAAIGFGRPALTAAALFYLLSSTLAASALFLLVELVERARQVETRPRRSTTRPSALPSFVDARDARRASTSTTRRRR